MAARILPKTPTDAGRAQTTPRRASGAERAMAEARQAGLLEGDSTEHVSFRAPKALIEAAKRQSGVTKPTELGLLGLAMLAQPDPAASFLKKTRGNLGKDHQLDY
ncbi:hypothetical protein EDC65_0654 [Stella humosa]|uniref:Uncharacterized protein n=2 Tax=Stella humosa TaxID=94 RepID=A0A3N1MEC4_9PROT|nr:hypothetical protein EDC65_0654 [Stella humosa]BBK31853.1 hypothetical protein STHU_24870 [Stella humosa]